MCLCHTVVYLDAPFLLEYLPRPEAMSAFWQEVVGYFFLSFP